MKPVKPFMWVPTLYLGESLPYAAVMLMSIVLYQEMGLSDTKIALYTSWLGLPWVIKPIWSPFIDSIRTKHWWVLSMQLLIGAALALVAFTLPTSAWLQSSLALFMLVAFSSSTHDISADGFYILGLSNQDQELYVGVRNTFYRIGMVLGQGGLVMFAGLLQQKGVGIPVSWSITFLIVAALMVVLFAYHSQMLPVVEQNEMKEKRTNIWHDFCQTFIVFFKKPHIITALCFILLFRLPEGLLTKIVPLFLKRGLKKCLWPLVLCITLPDVVYVYLSYVQSTNLWLIGSCVFVEQLGYGLGFTAYTLYLVSFAHGERSTSVFSLCTAFQYLGGVMLPGMVSGWMSDSLGYYQFFIYIMAFCLVTFFVTALLKLPEEEK